ncbi:MAG TPA: T9SS type A sorting domain-containing protein [Chitinophagaceae bacterium]
MVCLSFNTYSQITIVNYDFNSGTSYDSLTPALVPGITSIASSTEAFDTLNGEVTTATAFTANSTPGNAIAMNNSSGNNTNYFQFQLGGSSLNNYTNYKIYLQARRSNTGATTITVAYSTDGTNFINFGTASTGNGSFNATIIDFSGIPALNNRSTIYFRLLASGASGSGTLRVDNFEIQAALSTGATISSDYFKSNVVSGNWGDATTWVSSHDNIIWFSATGTPTSSASGIYIVTGSTIIINTPAMGKAITIDSGATLIHNSGINFSISDGAGDDFIINGTYVLNGTQPMLPGDVTAQVNSGGVVRADGNNGGQSDAFASNPKVLFKTGSVFEWAIITGANVFNTSNVIYFNAAGSNSQSPVFRINAASNVTVGANGTTTFNGKFEVASGKTITFQNTGIKIFRDGLGGHGTIVHKGGSVASDNASGTFKITGTAAVIDGTVTINLNNNTTAATNEMEISDGASVTVSGSPQINVNSGSDFVINGSLTESASTPIFLLDGNLTVNGSITDLTTNGAVQGGSSNTTLSNITIGNNTTAPTNSASVGTLTFTAGFGNVNTFTLQRTVSHSNPSVVLGSDIITNNLVLTKGILATDNHLFTYNKTGSLVLPAAYTDSYICTCNSSGNEITSNGSNGFRINNVSGNIDQIFPVGTDFVSPNRMALNMNGVTTNDYTVIVGKGDLGGTPLPRVNRIWYVSQADATNTTATMKLYFTKRDWLSDPFGNGQDEIEDGFIYSDPRLIQKDYNDLFVNTSTKATIDVPDYTGAADNTEVFARYFLGVSADYQGNTNGINSFSRFSVVNMSDIILAVKLLNFKAYQKGSGVQIEWSVLNETNIDHYEVEKSVNGTIFTKIVSVHAVNTGNSVNYSKTDFSPGSGNNFYRIKAVDKGGSITYTSIVLVNIDIDKTTLRIYPNPVQDKMVNIQFTSLPKGKYELLLYNIAGQTVFSSRIEHTGGSSIESFILPLNIRCGAYILKVFNERIHFTNRVVVE